MTARSKLNLQTVLESALSLKKNSLVYSEPAESTTIGCYKLLPCYDAARFKEALKTENGAFILAYIVGGNSITWKEIKDAYKSIYSMNLHPNSLSFYLNKFIESKLIFKKGEKYASYPVSPQDCK